MKLLGGGIVFSLTDVINIATETGKKAIEIVFQRDNGDWQGENEGEEEKWLDSGNILKV